MTRSFIDRTTDHQCPKMVADFDHFTSQGRAIRPCVNCDASIPEHFVQFSSLCSTCRLECTDDSDVSWTETCAWCGAMLDKVEQLSLFGSVSLSAQDVIVGEQYPTSYRIDKHGYFIVTADVPGVGKLTSKHRFLWEATVSVRQQVARALEAAPSAMF